jgi:amino acid adenylation domain-containing protein
LNNFSEAGAAKQLSASVPWPASTITSGTLPELFEAQVSCTPDAAALLFEGISTSYAELNSRANRLARLLIAEGIEPEDIVALAVPRSPDMVVALLAILKSGAAYLPLDPQYPVQRLALMLGDAKPVRLVTTRALAAAMSGSVFTDLPSLFLDDPLITDRLAQATCDNLDNRDRRLPLLSQHPAYVIYTSGSTGRPKGVVVTHAGLASLAASQIERFAITPESRVLQFASISFDAAVSEIFTTLLSGACLVLAASERMMPGATLANLCDEAGVTHATLPPSVLASMPEHSLASCSTLVVAGEACPPHLLGQWMAGRRVINAYGPTESTVCATMSEPLAEAVAPPLGQPIRNTEIHLLDHSLQPVPVDVPGELYIAGDGLARGYLGQPGLTAERFLANPFGPPGSRMYRSGDLACRRADGSLVFLGRIDHQVKIRGFRIEPGEVEAVLARHPSVRQVAVIARMDRSGQHLLVGYVVPAEGEVADTVALRAYLIGLLPDYMVPATLVAVADLPLTPNGKLNRDALPEPAFGSTIHAAPRTPREEMLTQLFAEVLCLDEVGIADSFFDLGGHSLTATRLLSRIRSVLGVELELSDVFDTPTVAGLAARLDQLPAARMRPTALLRRRAG